LVGGASHLFLTNSARCWVRICEYAIRQSKVVHNHSCSVLFCRIRFE
jgi:hypothetical protein